MKRSILVLCLAAVLLAESSGQWYTRNYHVSNFRDLNEDQLYSSLETSRKGLLVSGIIAGCGGAVFALFRYGHPGMSDDPSLFEQMIGDEGVNAIGMVTGLGLFAGGFIASTVYLVRIARIKGALDRDYTRSGSLYIKPALLLKGNNLAATPGIKLVFTF